MRAQTLQKLSPHVYWMPPDVPDRPSLAAIVGTRHTLMLDGAASPAHMQLFLDALAQENVRPPDFVALTHWHWDHIFGLATLHVPVIANVRTGRRIAELVPLDWTDDALDQRVADGREIAFCADNIKLELPEPRAVKIVQPSILFDKTLQFDLGGVTCIAEHVGGDHAEDSTIFYIPEDQFLFLGDCLYDAIYAPVRHYTRKNILPLLEKILHYPAVCYSEGHSSCLTSAEMRQLAQQFQRAAQVVMALGENAPHAIPDVLKAELGLDTLERQQEFTELVQGFVNGMTREGE